MKHLFFLVPWSLGRGDLGQKIQIISSISIKTSVTKRSWLVKSKKFYRGRHTHHEMCTLARIFCHQATKHDFFLSTALIDCLVLAFLVSSSVTRRIWPVFLEICKWVVRTPHECSLLPEFFLEANKWNFL